MHRLRNCSTSKLEGRVEKRPCVELHVANLLVDDEGKRCRRLPDRKPYVYSTAIDDRNHISGQGAGGNHVGHCGQASFDRSTFLAMTAKHFGQCIQTCFHRSSFGADFMHLVHGDMQVFNGNRNRVQNAFEIKKSHGGWDASVTEI